VSYGQRVLNEPDPYRKGIIVSDACEWLASRSKTTVDDEVVKLLGDVLKTPEGERLVRYILAKVPQ
jgi:HD-GYP domain-containing protein (c-di-GMP phosphodiesterase class II)